MFAKILMFFRNLAIAFMAFLVLLFPGLRDDPTDPTNPTEATTVAEETTEEDPGTSEVVLPISGSQQEIIRFYNRYGNAMKVYKGKVTVKKRSGTTSSIVNITGGQGVRDYAEKFMINDYQQRPTYTFTNGKSDRDNVNLSEWLPRYQSLALSVLSSTGDNGIKYVTCEAVGDGCRITIVMKDDLVSGADALSAKPKYVSKCMDTIELTAEDLKPFVLENADVNYTECKIEAVFNAQGLLTKLDVKTPVDMACKVRYGLIKIDADITSTYDANYTFTY